MFKVKKEREERVALGRAQGNPLCPPKALGQSWHQEGAL